ncbi:MAG: hypothetical protein ACRC5H_05805 [Treponemataceae bacterium]
MKIEHKIIIRDTLIFCGSLLILLIIVFYTTLFTRNTWKAGLKKQTQTVLDAAQKGNYIVGDFVQLKLPISSASAIYSLTINDEFPSPSFAIIVRVTGFSGPVPMVFISNSKGTFFKGIAGIANPHEDIFNYGITDSMIVFWRKKISKLLYLKEIIE